VAPPASCGRAGADVATLEEDDVTAHLTVIEVRAQPSRREALYTRA
jgi:hypothetical protein